MDESSTDPFFSELTQGYSDEEIAETQKYLIDWDAPSYLSVCHNILDHAQRKNLNPLKFLRKAHNFQKKGATRIPKRGYRWDSSAVYRKGNEYLIVRPNQFGIEKIVTYGINNE